MCANQFAFSYNCTDDLLTLLTNVKVRVAQIFEEYSVSAEDIVYVQLSFR